MDKLVSLVAKVPKDIRNDDDSSDRLSRHYSVLILVLFALVSGMNQYVGKPITCWAPTHFTGSHRKFANSYCWVKNTYYLPLEDEIPKEYEDDKRQEIQYYQWVPFILLTQALFFYLPCLIWRALNSKGGIDCDNIMNTAEDLAKTQKYGTRTSTMTIITNQIDRFLGSRISPSSKWTARCKRFLKNCFCCVFGSRLENYLTFLFIFVKLLYICNVLGQLYILNHVLKTDFKVFGMEFVRSAITGVSYNSSTAFPRVTMCDFNVRRLGNNHRYTLQCVLPINLYTEKMYVFLWFWMVFVAVVSCTSLFTWVVRALWKEDRMRYIKDHLCNMERLSPSTTPQIYKDFVDFYLRQDGVFLLRLIGHNTNSITVREIIANLWDHWNVSRKKKSDDIELNTLPLHEKLLNGQQSYR